MTIYFQVFDKMPSPVDTLPLADDSPYGVAFASKKFRLLRELNALSRMHYERCTEYRNLVDGFGMVPGDAAALEDVPLVHVRMFKRLRLKSIPDSAVFKTLTSSGTTGQVPSRIYLDADAAQAQTRMLVRILQTYLGDRRLPMLLIDHPSVVKDRASFSARGAGILGLSNFGRGHVYALNDGDMSINLDAIGRFVERYAGETVLMFGFTFMVWKYFVQALASNSIKLAFNNAILFHSGGWKKLEREAVSNEVFRAELAERAGVRHVHGFYGMVEQTGTVHVECEHGFLHAPSAADVIIRNPLDWSVCKSGQEGVIQLLSTLPTSYPGHSILSEDRGILHGEDDCACGRKGKYFRVLGRVPMAELRGCSDTA
jgi:hypothetical protein